MIYKKGFTFEENHLGQFNSITVINNNIFYVSEWTAIPLPLTKNISFVTKFLMKYYDFIKRILKLKFCYMNKFDMKENKLERIDIIFFI